MAGESSQKKLMRFRPPRVAITYDTTEEGNKTSTHSLPLSIGVMGNYSGQKYKKVKKLKDSKFLSVTKSNFDKVVESVAPELHITVANKLNSKTPMLKTDITFKSMADFKPGNLAQNIEPLREIMEKRSKLAELKEMIDSNDKLEQVLLSLSKSPDALQKFLPENTENTSENTDSNPKE